MLRWEGERGQVEREEEGGLSGSSVCTERRKKQEGDLYTGQRVKLAQPLSLEDSLRPPGVNGVPSGA